MSTNAFCAANSRSYSRAGTFTVAGTEFRGMRLLHRRPHPLVRALLVDLRVCGRPGPGALVPGGLRGLLLT
ncbi:hypothetical protein A5728_13035 [Kocuria sp. ICS0012]|nr:hypothetical protein A5728_13035 [Kocuria sp. ICS0012]